MGRSMNSWKSSACGSALTSPSSASSQSFYRALFIEPFWRSLWPCAFLWGSTFQTQHSFLPEASWSMTRTLVPVYPVPATCTSPSPHPPPITHTHTHTHTHAHTQRSVAWGSSLVRTLDALIIHVRVIQEPTIYTCPSAFATKLLPT